MLLSKLQPSLRQAFTKASRLDYTHRALRIESFRQRGAPAAGTITKDDTFGGADKVGQLKKLDFQNSSVSFKEKSLKELLRAYFIFTMCSYDKIVDNQAKLLKWNKALLGKSLFRRLMKATIYGQFEGGETKDEILATARRLSSNGVIPMFAYTAAEVHGVQESNDKDGSSSMRAFWEKNYDAMMEGLEITAASREFSSVRPKMTGKVTFLMSADSMRQLTDIILWNEGMVKKTLVSGSKTEKEQMKSILARVCDNVPAPRQLSQQSSDSYMQNLVHSADVSMELYRNDGFKELAQENGPIAEFQYGDEISWGMSQMRDIAKRAAELGVTWVIDAEQTYLQTGIDAVVLDLMRDFNRQYAVIHNTYQCYLKRTHSVIKRDLDIAEVEGFSLGGKIVRGAYIDEERRLAAQLGYEDPINDNYAATSEMYDKVVYELLSALKSRSNDKVDMIVATHNEDTVTNTIKQCDSMGIALDGANLMFAQLLGMRDHIAFSLGNQSLPGGKLIHYGDVEEGIAYLSRRLLENRGGLPTAALERKMIGSELSKRIFRI